MTSVETSSRERTLFKNNTARFCPKPLIEYVSNATFKLALPHRKKETVLWEGGKLGPVLGCLPPPRWFSLSEKHLFCILKLTLWYDDEACTTQLRKGTSKQQRSLLNPYYYGQLTDSYPACLENEGKKTVSWKDILVSGFLETLLQCAEQAGMKLPGREPW